MRMLLLTLVLTEPSPLRLFLCSEESEGEASRYDRKNKRKIAI